MSNKLRRPAKFPWKTVLRVLTLLVLCAVGYGAWAVRVPLMASTQDIVAQVLDARVKSILVEGADYTSPADIAAALQIGDGDSLVGFDAASARARLEALDWVKSAAVSRKLPSTVKVEIFEYVPFARVEISDAGEDGAESGVWVADKTGHLIVASGGEDFKNLPLLSGVGAAEEAPELFVLLMQHPNFLSQLKRADYVGERRWDLRFAGGVLVKLPEDDVAKALTILQQLEASRHVLAFSKGTVDLRLSDRIVLELDEESDAADLVL